MPISRGERAREDLRRSFGLRALAPAENDFRFSTAPPGVYGFGDVVQVRHFVGNAPPLQVEEFRLKKGPADMLRDIEVHKLSNGSIRLVGFVSSDVAFHLRNDPRESTRFTIYNAAWPSADYLISLPMSAVKTVHDVRAIPTGREKPGMIHALDLELNLN